MRSGTTSRCRTYAAATGIVLWSTYLLNIRSLQPGTEPWLIPSLALAAAYVAMFLLLWRRAGHVRAYPLETATIVFSSPAFYAALMRIASPPNGPAGLSPALSLRGLATVVVAEHAATEVYLVASILVLFLGGWIWHATTRHDIRFSSALLTLVLVSPVVRDSDLLVLMPAFVLLASWILEAPDDGSRRVVGWSLGVLYFAPMLTIFAEDLRVPVVVGAMTTLLATLGFAVLENGAARAAQRAPHKAVSRRTDFDVSELPG